MRSSILAKTVLAFSALSLVATTALQAKVSDAERNALVKFYDATNGDGWKKNDNWKDGDPCENKWRFVGCNDDKDKVLTISINRNDLDGEIPAELGDLENLKYLSVYDNTELTGKLPKELGNLENLEYLKFSRGKIGGEIPKELGNLENLRYLDFIYNQLEGEIPKEFENLKNLLALTLLHNKLEGEIPKELGNLENLTYLSLLMNNVEGEIPKELGNLENLTYLSLNRNKLKGKIPKELCNLKNLIILRLHGNKLEGEILKEFADLDNLRLLELSGNNLEGEIKEVVNLDKIESLILSNNKFTGEIPKELGELDNLVYLDIGSNKLEGKIPKELVNLDLLYLDLSCNKLEGEILKELGDIDNLRNLYLSGNKLKGKIPLELQNLDDLESIDVTYNALFTDDIDLDDWLDDIQRRTNNWSGSQTIAVTDVTTSNETDTKVQINWSTIEFDDKDDKDHDGGYVVYVQEDNEVYNVYGSTEEKTDDHLVVKDLKAETDYCFKVQTFTQYKSRSENNVTSYMSESSCTKTKEEQVGVTIDDIAVTEDDTPTFSGTSKLIDGDLTFEVNDKEYSVTPADNGDWSFTLPDEDALDDGDYTSYVKGSDGNGNDAKDEDKFEVTEDPVVTIDDIGTTEDDTPTFSGSSKRTEGDLTFNVNGKDYSVTPADNGDWSFTLPDEDALDDNDYTATIKGSDEDEDAQASDRLRIDADKPEVTVDDIDTTDDDTPEFTGTSKYTDGDLTFNVNDKDYKVTPEDNGDWSFTLPDDDALDDGDYTSHIKGTDANDNKSEAEDDFTVDTSYSMGGTGDNSSSNSDSSSNSSNSNSSNENSTDEEDNCSDDEVFNTQTGMCEFIEQAKENLG